jgi:hypothetical protein
MHALSGTWGGEGKEEIEINSIILSKQNNMEYGNLE